MAVNQAQVVERRRYTGELVPHIVDHLAAAEPRRLYAEYPVSTLSYAEGYRKITYGDFANAINGVAWWLHQTLGPGKDFEVLAYIGPNDLRYPALILGAVKAGYLLFLTSSRNSVAAQMNLFDRLKCRTMLSPQPRPPPVSAVLAVHQLRTLDVPSVEDLLDKRYSHFPFKKTSEEALSEPLFVVPTLGFESQDQMYHGKRVFMTFPPFHGASIVSHLFNAVPFGTVLIAPTSGAIPSAQGLVEGLKKSPADVAFIVPSIVQELSQSPELLDYCAKNLKMIVYCGGDLPQSIGNVIASRLPLMNQFGASELGLSAFVWRTGNRDPEDWKYIQFHPDIGAELRNVIDDTYELCIVSDSEKKEQQPTFTLFPDRQVYESRDLFVRHPSKDKRDLWKWLARADDIIVFLNGEKTNPISMEQHIVSRNPEVAAALVAGAQRLQAALLIEPVTDGKDLSLSERAAFIENIWPTIEEANQDCPAHAQIAKSHILFTQSQKPLLRAGKGTVQRTGTLKSYTKELDTLYIDADAMSGEIDEKISQTPSGFDDIHMVSKFINESISSITKWQKFDDADNFFTLGLDSLQALMTVRRLKQGLAIPNIALSTIYTNPSISALTGAVLRLSKQNQVLQTSDEQAKSRVRSDMLKEYQGKIDRIFIPAKIPYEAHGHNVILTGSTGALGSYILHVLLANPTVAHVYCLNRRNDGLSLQIGRNQAHELRSPLEPSRVTFLTADLSQAHLGLQFNIYASLLATASLVIHNAWPVNFNLALPSFRTQLDGIVNLIDFTASAAASPHLFFISSISSVLSYRSPSLRTPEEVILADSAPGPNGYAESKYLSECLLHYATRKLPINSSFTRVGQIAGAAEHAGLWNRAEWFPSLVISSLHVGAVPDSPGSSLGKIEWVPIDLLAEILVELAYSRNQRPHQNGLHSGQAGASAQQKQAHVFHPLNPHKTTWDAIRPIVTDELLSLTGKSLETVSLGAWLGRVRKDIESTLGSQDALEDGELKAYLRVNPAVKLLSFYEGLRIEEGPTNELETKETARSSSRLRALEGIKPEWIRKWVREWIE